MIPLAKPKQESPGVEFNPEEIMYKYFENLDMESAIAAVLLMQILIKSNDVGNDLFGMLKRRVVTSLPENPEDVLALGQFLGLCLTLD